MSARTAQKNRRDVGQCRWKEEAGDTPEIRLGEDAHSRAHVSAIKALQNGRIGEKCEGSIEIFGVEVKAVASQAARHF